MRITVRNGRIVNAELGATTEPPITVPLRGWNVLAHEHMGMLMTTKYGNRTQAQKKAAQLGPPWEVLAAVSPARGFTVGYRQDTTTTNEGSPSREEVLGSLYDLQLRAIAVTHDQIEQAAKSFGEADAMLSSWVPMLVTEGLVEQRADGNYDFTRLGIEFGARGWREALRKRKSHQNKIKRSEEKIDKEVERAWYRLASGVQVPIFDLSKIFRDVKLELAAGVDIDTAVRAAIDRYQVGHGP